MQNNHKTDEKSTAELLEEFEQKYNYRSSKEVNLTKMQNSDTGMQEQVTEETAAQDSVSFDASGVGISLNSEGVDPITEAIRKEILEKQREQLRLYFSSLAATRPELAEHTLDDTQFQKFLSRLNNEQRKLVNDALENEKVKAAMEQIEIVGYKNIYTRFSSSNYPSGFKPMDWSTSAELSLRSQIVKNGVGDEIATIKEQTHTTKPLTISKQDGSVVLVNSYRTIDFPVKLEEPASGTMHLYAHKNHGACPVDVVLPISFCYGDVCRLENKVTVLTDVNIIWCWLVNTDAKYLMMVVSNIFKAF